MPSAECDPKLEATTQTSIRDLQEVLRAIVSEARGSARDKDLIRISLDWPTRLPKPLAPQIAQQFPNRPRVKAVPNEIGALNCYLEDLLSAADVILGRFHSHAADLVHRRTREIVMSNLIDALLPESALTRTSRSEIPGIDLRSAAALMRLGGAKKVSPLRIAYWIEHEWPFDAISAEIRFGGLPEGYPVDLAGRDFGGRGAPIAQVFRFVLDGYPSLDLNRIASWLETPGKVGSSPAQSEEPGPLVARLGLQELFWLFGRTSELRAWTAGFRAHGQDLLELMADMAIMHPAESESAVALALELDTSSGRRTTAEGAVTRKQEQTGAPATFSSSPEAGAPVAVALENSSLIQQIRSSPKKPLYTLLAFAKAKNPGVHEARALLLASDKMISDIRSEAEQKGVRSLVHASVPPGWKDGIGEQQTLVVYWDRRDPEKRGSIKTYVSGVKLIQ
jgi:hypothetical protein